jgi:hypothetical protein
MSPVCRAPSQSHAEIYKPLLDLKVYDDTDNGHDAGRFLGKLSVYNNLDSHNDRVLPGAFARRLSA